MTEKERQDLGILAGILLCVAYGGRLEPEEFETLEEIRDEYALAGKAK